MPPHHLYMLGPDSSARTISISDLRNEPADRKLLDDKLSDPQNIVKLQGGLTTSKAATTSIFTYNAQNASARRYARIFMPNYTSK